MRTTVQEEEDLVSRLSADLAGTFERLMEVYQDRLYALALRLSGNAQDAEEIAQDAFVRAYRALCGYTPERTGALAVRPWLYRITLNVYRNRARGKRVGVVAWEESTEGRNWGLSSADQERPEDATMHAELQHDLAALLAELPAHYRVAVVLRYVEGLSYAELAAVLEQPIGTVKAHVHRGIRRLRERMSAFADERGVP